MSLEVKPHPLEDKLFELQTKAKNLRAEANRVFMVARELDRQAFEAMAEAKAVAVIFGEYDRQQAATELGDGAFIIPPGDYSAPFVLPQGAALPGTGDESELMCGICGDDGTMYDQDANGNELKVPCVCIETEAERAARFDRQSQLKAKLGGAA